MCLSFLLVFSSCASHKEESIQQTIQGPERAGEVQEPIEEQPTRTELIHQALEDPQQHFSQGNLQEAIDGYTEALDIYPGEPLVLDDYIRTLEKTKISADNDYKSQKYAQAEEYYTTLLKNFPRFKIFEESLSFDAKYLDSRIKACGIAIKDTQAQDAISAGNYAEAIDKYKEAIRVYPERDSFPKGFIGVLAFYISFDQRPSFIRWDADGLEQPSQCGLARRLRLAYGLGDTYLVKFFQGLLNVACNMRRYIPGRDGRFHGHLALRRALREKGRET